MEVSEMASRSEVLGTDCYCGDPEAAAQLVLERARAGAGGYACFCNVHVVVTALHDAGLRQSLVGAWMAFPDGAPVAWFQRRSGRRDARRVPGPDLMPRVVELGQPVELRHYLFGSSDDVLRRLEEVLSARAPAAVIAGASAPPVSIDDLSSRAVLDEIRAARPDVVWCALGAPKQELWMCANHAVLAPALLLGVGAAFDFLAGTKRRAPSSLQRLGLEWAHRLASEPRRLLGRYARTNAEFVVRAGYELARGSRR
jgi:N-acetylglucosaminyldiphosphoundecaprenol N-acetyl-beta-D-mannosaminyltransferase